MPICKKCGSFFGNRVVIDGEQKNIGSRKYCLSCSPFDHHNTRQLHKSQVDRDVRRCGCGETDPSKFYGHKKSICGKCHNEYTTRMGNEKREKAIRIKGGRCSGCGYNRYFGSLDFHHLDPKQKDSKFRNLKGWSWKKIEQEIAKCVLLCANCHGEVHAGLRIIGV